MAIAALPSAVWVAITALFDPQDARNPLPGVFYVLLWVGLVALSLAVGPVWRAIKIWLLVYLAVTLAGALGCGERRCARADPFEVYSMVASRLSALRRNRDGRIAIGNPFDHLPSLPVRAGTVAVLAVLLGSTAFDSTTCCQCIHRCWPASRWRVWWPDTSPP
jgi:hypothetical protein